MMLSSASSEQAAQRKDTRYYRNTQGRFIGVEIKIGADRQSDDQKLREQEINKAGRAVLHGERF